MDPIITVFTPTYNRETTLTALYESLCCQTCKDFEWIVIDDDSSDNTQQLVDKFINENKEFCIRYKRQAHGGKHRAINNGVKMAQGKYFFIVDSDDYLIPSSIETVKRWIADAELREDLAGVAGLKQFPDGEITGEFPWKSLRGREWIDVENTRRYFNKLMGDKAEVYKTDLLREYPFAEFSKEFFLTESTCWNEIANAGYKIRWYPVPIYVCEYQEGGLTKSGANSYIGHINNLNGYKYHIKKSINYLPCYEAATYFREYNGTLRNAGYSLKDRAEGIDFSLRQYLFYLTYKVPVSYAERMGVKLLRAFR